MKLYLFVIILLFSLSSNGNTVKFSAIVLDDITGNPLTNVSVGAGFTMDAGPVWENRFKYIHKEFLSDADGVCNVKGESNCGKAGCYIKEPPNGFYKPGRGNSLKFKTKNFLGVWQPDNLVVTLSLDRVEHPIPLFVKQIFSRASDSVSSNYFDIGKGKMEFDMVKGGFLPPIGKGEYADICFTRLEREDLGIGTNFNGRTALAYRDSMVVKFLGEGNGLIEIPSKKTAGIKIRTAPLGGYKTDYLVTKGKDKSVKRFSSSNPDRNFAFRIRTKRDKNGKVVSAYYGKIYGDIEIKKPYTVEVSVAAPSFLYYLNPTSLDRNLEWDMMTNLCPEPGGINHPREP